MGRCLTFIMEGECLERRNSPWAKIPPISPTLTLASTVTHLGVPLHHNVIDVRLQCHADVLALPRLKLEDVQHPRDAHLEEDGSAAAAKLHDVAKLRRVQVLLRHRPGDGGSCKM